MKRESGSQSLKSRNTNVHLFDVRLLRAFHALGSVFATLENTIIIFLSPPPPPPKKITIVPRETENDSYAKFGGWAGQKDNYSIF